MSLPLNLFGQNVKIVELEMDVIPILIQYSGAGVAQRWCNGLPRNDPGFDSRWYGVKTELHILRKGQSMGALSLNDFAVDGMLNTTNQPIGGDRKVRATGQGKVREF